MESSGSVDIVTAPVSKPTVNGSPGVPAMAPPWYR
jgi:hypothetical protein